MQDKNEHPVWQQKHHQLITSFANIKVTILVLGPGQGSPGDKKRLTIKSHLKSLNNNYDVALCEELEQDDIKIGMSAAIKNIGLHISFADLIFALLIDDTRVSGVLTELNKFDDFTDFTTKTFLIVPAKRSNPSKNSNIPLIWQTIRNFDQRHILSYSPEEFNSCTRIRSFVGEMADRMVKMIGYQRFMNESGINLPLKIDELD